MNCSIWGASGAAFGIGVHSFVKCRVEIRPGTNRVPRFGSIRAVGDLRSPADHCVFTATLVEPRVTPLASLNRTKMRLFAGSLPIVLDPVMKIAKVGVSLPRLMS
jgi:hypothetical protein